MSRTTILPVSADGTADARGAVVVSLDTARAVLAALAGLTVHPWPGVEHGEGRPSLSLGAALEGVPATPEAIMQAHAAADAAAELDDGVNQTPNVRALGDGRFEWRPLNGGERSIVIHFRGDDAVISWRSDVAVWRDVDSGTAAGLVGERVSTRGHRSRFIGRVIGWASPRSVAITPMVGHSGPVRAI